MLNLMVLFNEDHLMFGGVALRFIKWEKNFRVVTLEG